MALEARLRAEALKTNVPLARLRKTVAFDRLLARMMDDDRNERWLLKGGLALQVRMLEGARTTEDIDVLLRESGTDAYRLLVEASKRELGDGFEFEVGLPQAMSGDAGLRVPMQCRLDSREFESFHVDIGWATQSWPKRSRLQSQASWNSPESPPRRCAATPWLSTSRRRSMH
jgi:hypothetical protein